MRNSVVFLILFCLLSSTSVKMQGQALPSLETAKEISKGTLPNGIEYFLVNNSYETGFADYALVRKEGIIDDNGRKSLTYLKHFVTRQPYRLLSENGVSYGREGYISRLPSATLFSFKDVPTYKSEVADSTLMMVMDIASGSRSPQAIIISGDIDVSKIRERMDLLSMMAGKLDKPAASSVYDWKASDEMRVSIGANDAKDISTIELTYRTERQDQSSMNTAVPLISRSYAEILSQIVKSRVSTAFSRAGLSIAKIDCRYIDSAQSPYEEYYNFKFYVSSKDIGQACAIIARQFASIDKYGASIEELNDAKINIEFEADQGSSKTVLNNSEYVDKCVASYLYGSNLAPRTTIDNLLHNKNLAADRELSLVNNFASALLDSEKNLILKIENPEGIDSDTFKRVFLSSWNDTEKYKTEEIGELSFNDDKAKIKLKSTADEPISGGKIWTFSNGIKVLFKHVPCDGKFYYSLMLKHNLASFPGLKYGEGPFADDIFEFSDIAGMSGAHFRQALKREKISMDASVNISNTLISGSAPSGNFNKLMSALSDFAYKRKANETSFKAYKNTAILKESLRSLEPKDVISIMDSTMRPEYLYTGRSMVSSLGDDFAKRSESFFDNAFSKVNDGMLILIGDLDEEKTQKDLCRYLSSFKTSNKLSNSIGSQGLFSSGSISHFEQSASGSIGGLERGAYISLSAPLTYNINNYMAFKAAEVVVRKELSKQLVEQGIYPELETKMEFYPAERMTIYISCHPCDPDGLPLGIIPAEPEEILERLRIFADELPSIPISDAEMKAYKALLLNEAKREDGQIANIMNAVLLRYSDGKDIVSGKTNAINSLNSNKVKTILEALVGGSEVEYVID